jgi:hypothetical protein
MAGIAAGHILFTTILKEEDRHTCSSFAVK